ncbi:CDC8 [Giardia lamblia P15]|uniref:dTMP kinase n=1 Tax=Giardia intestinalis (strain P15) TaxID=658858 RepID=E1F4A7_GIAIA|nr:CDC8 [Giardia lamblia P15]
MNDTGSSLFMSIHKGTHCQPSNLQDSEYSEERRKGDNITRGLFIVIEGLDRAGKDTMIDQLVALLKQTGESVMVQAFPDRTTKSGIILDRFLRRELDLSDWDCHKLYAENRKELEEGLCNTLLTGTTVICSRYAYSGVAYTAAKGHDIRRCMEADKGLLRPDLVVFLDVDAKTVALRTDFGKERYETQNFQIKVYAAFQTLWGLLRNSQDGSQDGKDCTTLLTFRPENISEAPRQILQAVLERKKKVRHILYRDLFHLELNLC